MFFQVANWKGKILTLNEIITFIQLGPITGYSRYLELRYLLGHLLLFPVMTHGCVNSIPTNCTYSSKACPASACIFIIPVIILLTQMLKTVPENNICAMQANPNKHSFSDFEKKKSFSFHEQKPKPVLFTACLINGDKLKKK